MPRGSPFTKLCQQTAKLSASIYADLHTHSSASDGKQNPFELMQLAILAKVHALAITDHDTFPELDSQTGNSVLLQDSVTLISGVEISTRHHQAEHHIVGIFVSSSHAALLHRLETIQKTRRQRFLEQISVLQSRYGCNISPAKLDAIISSTRSLTRRHIAELLISDGIARNYHHAFSSFLGPLNRIVTRDHCIPSQEAIQLIHEASGIAILAHPRKSIDINELDELSHFGLDGIETSFPGISVSRQNELVTIAKSLNLVTSGGSDFHAKRKGSYSLGSCGVTEAGFQRLSERCQQYR